jgi:hypothetical protein
MIESRAIAALPLFAMLFVLEARAGDPPEFKPFSSKEGRFTISFPGTPEQSTRSLKSPIGDMVLQVFKVARNNDKEAYTLIYYDYPPEAIKSTDPEKIFDAAQQGGLDATHGKVKKKTISSTDKTPSKRDLNEIQGRRPVPDDRSEEIACIVIMVVPPATQGGGPR